MDLSKVYDCLPHHLIMTYGIWLWHKLEVYGFGSISLKLFQSYFLGWKERVKIGSAISEWIDILTGIPQGSILGCGNFLKQNIEKKKSGEGRLLGTQD